MRTLKEATTDKEVKRVTVSKEYITIFFTDQTEVKASKDEYFDNYLYPGTIIKKEEMNRLLKEEEIISAYIYLKRIPTFSFFLVTERCLLFFFIP